MFRTTVSFPRTVTRREFCLHAHAPWLFRRPHFWRPVSLLDHPFLSLFFPRGSWVLTPTVSNVALLGFRFPPQRRTRACVGSARVVNHRVRWSHHDTPPTPAHPTHVRSQLAPSHEVTTMGDPRKTLGVANQRWVRFEPRTRRTTGSQRSLPDDVTTEGREEGRETPSMASEFLPSIPSDVDQSRSVSDTQKGARGSRLAHRSETPPSRSRSRS